MTEMSKPQPDNTEVLMLMVGVGAALLGYFMPAITFRGTGNAMHDLAIVEKLPLMSALAFAALAAAVATRFVPNLQKWAQPATVVAVLAILAPALWGFMAALDAWSGLRTSILQIAGTRTVRIDPGPAYLALAAGATLLALSLRARGRPATEAQA